MPSIPLPSHLTGGKVEAHDLLESPIFKDALEILKADATWLQETADSINQLYDAPDIQIGQAWCAVVRFSAVAEELYKRHIIDRPFWMKPEASEVRVSVYFDIYTQI